MRLNKLKAKLREYDFNYRDFSKKIKLNVSSFSNKINGKIAFNSREIAKIKKILNLTNDEVVEIFINE